MLEKIRAATPEEIEAFNANNQCNLTSMSRVLAMGEMKAVWRVAHELDPVDFAGQPYPKMYKFIWGMENIMRGAGCTEYFFNVPADDPKYQKVIEDFGGQRLSKQPDYRYKVNL